MRVSKIPYLVREPESEREESNTKTSQFGLPATVSPVVRGRSPRQYSRPSVSPRGSLAGGLLMGVSARKEFSDTLDSCPRPPMTPH